MAAATLTEQAPQLVEQALALRSEHGYNCAQAVGCALAPLVGVDADAVYRLSEGFGSGMGGTTETCGAISGAVMVLSQLASAGTAEPGTTKGKTYKLVRRLVDDFRAQNTTTICRELKGVGSETGVLRTCPGCIEDAVRISCEIIDAYRA
ncbi:C-GCAxxG-C-C family protein [Enorma phocaeensis]|uniref:C-GCAxxG-C-C family protein n=1 Tax=Enorma phocaeensis TaxID=1871019 RepID=A0ABT7V7H3_9ACTN|nr:C-GCAxxG-C-C family protein [Enorma phocaeensis]MDM8274445.1 C-GCAxxG-C-C family protein [Enorma phocaeensis]